MKTFNKIFGAAMGAVCFVTAASAFPPPIPSTYGVKMINDTQHSVAFKHTGMCAVQSAQGEISAQDFKEDNVTCGFENEGSFAFSDTAGGDSFAVVQMPGCKIQQGDASHVMTTAHGETCDIIFPAIEVK